MQNRRIPTPLDEDYWDRDALIAEEKRVFEVCNGCRLCWNLCPSFPALFNAVDALDTEYDVQAAAEEASASGHDHDAPHIAEVRDDVMGQAEALEKISLDVHKEVADLCYQCKLCDPICPFTPPHEFAIDFPRLMLRRRAIDARENGISMQDRFLGNPDLVGTIGSMLPTIANMANENPINRKIMESVVGIHHKRKLPRFAKQTFRQWWKKRHQNQPRPEDVTGKKVVLFYTCSVQWNEPQVGRAAVEVLEHNGVTVYAPEFKCCGMPALDGGDVKTATSWAEHNIDVLIKYVRAGCDIVSPGPTCSYMLKHEWKDYTKAEEAKEVAAAGHDLMEYINKLRRAKELKTDYQEELGPIGYHVPCHLKVQKIGFRSRDVLKKVPGTKVTLVDQCSCMDGTWGMKKEYYDLSVKGAKKLIDELKEAGTEDAPATFSSDCLIAKLQIAENTGQDVFHPIELLWKAYGGSDETPLSIDPAVHVTAPARK